MLPATSETPDPFPLLELSRDVRPPDYAGFFAHLAATGSGLDPAVVICAAERPPWLTALTGAPGVAIRPLGEALRELAEAPESRSAVQ